MGDGRVGGSACGRGKDLVDGVDRLWRRAAVAPTLRVAGFEDEDDDEDEYDFAGS